MTNFLKIKFSHIKISLTFFLIIAPIFVNLDISQGLRFDINAFNKDKTSLPLSVLVILLTIFFNLKILLKNKLYILFFFSSLLMVIICTLINGVTRIIITFIQMNFFLISFYIFKNIYKNYDKEILLKIFFKTLSFVLILKLFFDILMVLQGEYRTAILAYSIISPYFINKSIAIYNWYSYFPFVYFLAGILSLRNIWYKEMFLTSFIVFFISLYALTYSHSRLYTYGFYMIPFLILFFIITKFSRKLIFNICLFLVISLTVLFTIFPYTGELSMFTRFELWRFYFFTLEPIHLLFPFINEYRAGLVGSMHNEFLEIVTFFGIFSIFFFLQFYKMVTNSHVLTKYKMTLKLVIFILVCGMLIQINLLNPYLSTLIGLFLSITIQTNKFKYY